MTDRRLSIYVTRDRRKMSDTELLHFTFLYVGTSAVHGTLEVPNALRTLVQRHGGRYDSYRVSRILHNSARKNPRWGMRVSMDGAERIRSDIEAYLRGLRVPALDRSLEAYHALQTLRNTEQIMASVDYGSLERRVLKEWSFGQTYSTHPTKLFHRGAQ